MRVDLLGAWKRLDEKVTEMVQVFWLLICCVRDIVLCVRSQPLFIVRVLGPELLFDARSKVELRLPTGVSGTVGVIVASLARAHIDLPDSPQRMISRACGGCRLHSCRRWLFLRGGD